MVGSSVDIVEVAPRDGLQDEPVHLDTALKVQFIERLIAAGLRRIEARASCIPKRSRRWPMPKRSWPHCLGQHDVAYSGLVLNERGLDRAIEADVDEINFVVVATDTFSQKNQKYTTQAGLDLWARIAERASETSIRTAVTVGAAFGCPFEGEVDVGRIRWVVEQLAAHPPDEISLADTIGVAVPSDVTTRLGIVNDVAPDVRTRLHVHNTRNTGIANAYAAVQAGVSTLDASTGGIGGCPFAPAATGNIPTEDLVYMLSRMGVETGVKLEPLLDTVAWLGEKLGQEAPGMLGRAGLFPRTAA